MTSDDNTSAGSSNTAAEVRGMVKSTSTELLEDIALNVKHEVPRPESADSKQLWANWKDKTTSSCMAKVTDSQYVLESVLPCIKWMRSYDKSNLSTDIIAGLTVGIMIIPQSMSYAKLAGLPVEYGLYSALLPVFTYAVWGSSRQLAVGPVALVSLLLSTGLTKIIDPENADGTIDDDKQAIYNTLAIETAFLVGIVYLIMGFLQLGFVTILLSHAVVSGFTTGAAIIIGFSQLKYFFGYEVERADRLHEMIENLFHNIEDFDWRTFAMGCAMLVILMFMKNAGKTYPKLKWMRPLGPLTVTVLSIAVTWGASIDIPIVDYIPGGLPPFAGADIKLNDAGDLVTPIISITIVGFMESIAIAKQLASKHKYEIDSSQELIGLGMSNFVGALFGSYPITGSFSRSAVNHEAGAKSGISAIVTATLVGMILLLLTPIFEEMPLATLAAIVISGVFGLFDYEEGIHLWKVHKFDFLVWAFSFLGTLFLGAEKGLGIAVALSLLLVMYESARPHTAVLGKLPGTNVYRNVKQYPNAQTYDQLIVTRVDAPMYFANIQHVRDKIMKYTENAAKILKEKELRYVIVDCSPVSHIDTSALHIFSDLTTDLKARNIQICLCNPNITVMTKLIDSGLAGKIGEKYIFVSTQDAVQSCLMEIESISDEESPSLHEE